MNKISRKIFGCCCIIIIAVSLIVVISYPRVMKWHMVKHHELEIEDKTYSVRRLLENSQVSSENENAYLNYLGDITATEVYLIREDASSNPYTGADVLVNVVSEEVESMAELIFDTTKYIQQTLPDSGNEDVIYAGCPIKDDDGVVSALVIVDHVKLNDKTCLLYMMVLLCCLIPAMLILSFCAALLIWHHMKPIDRISYVIQELASGNYDIRTGVSGNNEFANLAREIDVLAEKLEESKLELERYQQLQKDYISNVSHELRTPVTIIRSSLEAIKDGVIPEDEIEEYQEQILTETISLQRLIGDMLELSRLENDEFVITKEWISVSEVLSDSVRSIRMIAADRNIAIQYDEPNEGWRIFGDYGRIRQMFIVVLENAVKYSEDNTTIRVTTLEKRDAYYISIQDEGCGIAEEDQQHIFEKFYRASYNNKSGTGLGLVIVKNIAARHKITIHLQSKENVGTKFTFVIPRL